jgi:sugar lactone lactonase YvrE
MGSADGTNEDAQFGSDPVTYVVPPDQPLYGPPVGPHSVAVDSAGNLYVADTGNWTIRKVAPIGTNWVVTTMAGLAGYPGNVDGTGSAARFGTGSALLPGLGALYLYTAGPEGVTTDSAGDLYVTDSGNNTIRKVTSAALVTTVAGTSIVHGSADGVGTGAQFYNPHDVAVDSAGNIYVADTGNNIIRKVTSAGLVSTLAGEAGIAGSSDGVGTQALFNSPEALAVDSAGNIYVADTDNYSIRKITPSGIVSTLAGGFEYVGVFTDYRYGPEGVAVDSSSNVYVAVPSSGTIQEITTSGNVITIAGQAGSIFGPADGLGTNAILEWPTGLAVDNLGDIYVMQGYNDFVRKMTPVGTNWEVSTITGVAGSYLDEPQGIAVDKFGNLYIEGLNSDTISKVTPNGASWAVTAIGGLAFNAGSVDGAGSGARFWNPEGVAVDSSGNVYVADTLNDTIRKGVFDAYGAANNAVTYNSPPLTNSLTVWLQPASAGGQWRFPWEVAWHNSGDSESNLVAGSYPVEFSAVSGWLAVPASLTVANNDALPVAGPTSYTNQYYPTIAATTANGGGSLTVTLGPNPPNGAYWGFLGEGTPKLPSGFTTNLAAGYYIITFAPVSGRVTPPNLSLQVQAGQPAYLSENYLLAQSPPNGVLLPYPVPTNQISDLTDYPFGFDGQLETDVGYGSGVAVQANVVLTAAHLVFDDQTLSYVSQAYWYTQEPVANASPGYPSDPLAARGWYLLSGYAAQRTNDMAVYEAGTYTPQAANLDVATLYFLSPVAGGGYAGYLPSDASPNTWLTGNALKMLVGYPVDGSQFDVTNVVAGQMYQTQPQPYPLALSTDPVADQQVYTATWFLGYPGDSGGPLYVQLNGYYYPAGVYLATLYNGTTPYASAVRAIDSEVVNLITNAAALGDSGTNHSGGGVIAIIATQGVNANDPGFVDVKLAPPEAVEAGAAWRLTGLANADLTNLYFFTNYFSTNWIVVTYTTNGFAVEFKPIAGWISPLTNVVTLIPNVVTNLIGFYTVTNPVMVADASRGIGIKGTAGTEYRIESCSSLTSGDWSTVSTNTIGTNGFSWVVPAPTTNNSTIFYRAVWLEQ